MKTRTERILDVLKIVSWIAFMMSIVYFVFEIGIFALSFFVDDAKMSWTDSKWKLTDLRNEYPIEYIFMFTFALVISFLNIKIWQNVNHALKLVNLKSPFSKDISEILEKIGYFLLSVCLINLIGDSYLNWLSHRIEGFNHKFDIDFTYLFIGGIVYIISQIFKRGVELQEEIDLTV